MMKRFGFVTMALSAFLVLGCGGGDDPVDEKPEGNSTDDGKDGDGEDGNDETTDEETLAEDLVGTWEITREDDETEVLEFEENGDHVWTDIWDGDEDAMEGTWSLEGNELTLSYEETEDYEGELWTFKEADTLSIAIVDGKLYYDVMIRTEGTENGSSLDGTWMMVTMYYEYEGAEGELDEEYEERIELALAVDGENVEATVNTTGWDNEGDGVETYEENESGEGTIREEDGVIYWDAPVSLGFAPVGRPVFQGEEPEEPEEYVMGVRLTDDIIAVNTYDEENFTGYGYEKQD